MTTTKEHHPMPHTPGPWKVEPRSEVAFIPPLQGIDPDYLVSEDKDSLDRQVIVLVSPIVHAYANARLIAAAPELLAALKGMLDWSRRVHVPNPRLEILNASTAIANAEGRSW